MVCAEMATRPTRSPPRIAAIGASSVGALATASPGSLRRNELTQETSGNNRITRMNDRMIPISKTPRIRPLSQGFAIKALTIWRWSTKPINPHRMRNTSIRIRKMRGEESLAGSAVFAIGLTLSVRDPLNMA